MVLWCHLFWLAIAPASLPEKNRINSLTWKMLGWPTRRKHKKTIDTILKILLPMVCCLFFHWPLSTVEKQNGTYLQQIKIVLEKMRLFHLVLAIWEKALYTYNIHKEVSDSLYFMCK